MKLLLPTYNYVEGPKRIVEELDNFIDITIVDNSKSNKIKEILKKNSKINFYKNLKFVGPKSNMNYGLKLLRGQFIIIMHDDEFIENKDIKRLSKLKLKKNIIYVSNFRVIKQNKIINFNLNNSLREFLVNTFPKLILFVNFIGPTACLLFYNKKKLNFDVNINFMFDTDFYYQVFLNNNVRFIDNCIKSIHKPNTVTSRTKYKKIIEFGDFFYFKKKYKIHFIKFIFYIFLSYILRFIMKINKVFNSYL